MGRVMCGSKIFYDDKPSYLKAQERSQDGEFPHYQIEFSVKKET